MTSAVGTIAQGTNRGLSRNNGKKGAIEGIEAGKGVDPLIAEGLEQIGYWRKFYQHISGRIMNTWECDMPSRCRHMAGSVILLKGIDTQEVVDMCPSRFSFDFEDGVLERIIGAEDERHATKDSYAIRLSDQLALLPVHRAKPVVELRGKKPLITFAEALMFKMYVRQTNSAETFEKAGTLCGGTIVDGNLCPTLCFRPKEQKFSIGLHPITEIHQSFGVREVRVFKGK